MDSRAVSPAVEKLLTIGIVTLFVGATTTTVFAGAVPQYRDAVGAEVGERVLAGAATDVEAAVPPNGTGVEVTRRVDLPGTIRGSAYRIRADGRRLVLAHPSDRISQTTGLVLPPSVTAVEGAWESGAEAFVEVHSRGDGLVVRLREGAA